jgi:aminopeptidase N
MEQEKTKTLLAQRVFRILPLSILVSIFAAAALAQGTPEIKHPCQFYKATTFANAMSKGREYWAQADTDTDLKHYKLDIEILPDTRVIQGSCATTAVSAKDGLTSMLLYFDRNGGKMKILSIGGNGVSYTTSGDTVTVTLDRAYNTGEQFTVVVNYSGTPADYGFGSFNWDHHGSGQYYNWAISSLSEPFFARTWFPCKDVLMDKADSAEIWVTVPDPLICASNGVLVGTDALPGNRHRFRWEENYPIITYLVSLAVSNYAVYSKTYNHLGKQMPCDYYLFPENNYNGSGSRAGCDQNVTQIEKLSDVYGQYPFINEKYGMAEVAGAGAYMEHQTCSSMLNVTNEGVNAHELSHQWWGDMVTCGSWAHIWLNEGFATYSEAIWQEQKNNGSYSAYINEMLSNYPSDVDDRVLRTNLNDVWHIFSWTVYGKGAWVLHMLRGMMGDAAFFQSLTNYRAAYEHSSANTQEFADICSQTWGRNTDFFFDQWIMNPGAPDYEYNWRDDIVNGQHRIRLAIWQKQNNRGYGLITMPVWFRVATGNGSVDLKLWCDDWVRVYDVAIPGAITSVTFDPDTHLLIKSKKKVTTALPPLPLLGDMNFDGRVDLRDNPIFQQALNGQITDKKVIAQGDFNYTGVVDESDAAVFADLLGKNCVTTPIKK